MPKADPDLAGLPSLDADGDEPTAKEVAAVLRELGLGAPAPAPKAKPAAEARPAAKSDGQVARAQPTPPPAATGIGAVVGGRVEAYQRAAAVASGRGDADAANQLLRRGLELNQALLLVLQQFPDPEAKPEPPSAAPADANTAAVPVVSAAEIEAAVSARVVQSMVDQVARAPGRDVWMGLLVARTPCPHLTRPRSTHVAAG